MSESDDTLSRMNELLGQLNKLDEQRWTILRELQKVTEGKKRKQRERPVLHTTSGPSAAI